MLPSYEHQGSVGLSAKIVQQFTNLQTSFQQQTAALGAALGASTNLNSNIVNYDILSSNLFLYFNYYKLFV